MSKEKDTKDHETEETEELDENACCCHGCPSKDSCVESDEDEK